MPDQELFTTLVKEMVHHPEAVSVERKTDEMGVLLTLRVAPEDLGQVIGKAGATAKALRTILRVVGAKNHSRLSMQIFQPERYRPELDESPLIDDPIATHF